MAHRIEQHDKQEGTTMGWHGLTIVKRLITLADNWLRQWETVETPLYFEGGEDSGFKVLRCSDVPGLTIGSPYNPDSFHPISNAAFLDLVQASIGGTQHEIVSVGSVRNRGRVFLSLKLCGMDKFTAAGRKFSSYLNFGNGHDKSSVLWVNTSNTCTVCDNTFSANLFSVEDGRNPQGDDIKTRLRHTKLMQLKFPALATLIDKAVGVQGEFQAELDKLAKVEIKPVPAEQLFAGFIGRNIAQADLDKGFAARSRNTVNRLVTLFGDGSKGNRAENLADAFSAVTDYYTHESSGGDNRMRQVLSSEYGAGMTAKADFWRTIRDNDKRQETIERGQTLLAHTTA